MRIAVLIMSLLLGLVFFVQSLLITSLGDLANDEGTSQSGAVGVFGAILWLVAAAFVVAFPLFSSVTFLVAGLLAFAASGDFPDLAVWGGVSLVFSVLSFFGWRGKKKDAREKATEKARQEERDRQLHELLTAQRAQGTSIA